MQEMRKIEHYFKNTFGFANETWIERSEHGDYFFLMRQRFSRTIFSKHKGKITSK